MDALIEEFPEYVSWIQAAMHAQTTAKGAYRGVSCTGWRWVPGTARPHVHVVHSMQDDLVSTAQPCAFLARAHQLDPAAETYAAPFPPLDPSHCAYWYRENGRTAVSELYQHALQNVPKYIHVDWHTTHGGHEEMQQTENYWSLLQKIVLSRSA